MKGPKVRDGVTALVSGALGRIGWAWLSLIVRESSIGLQSMALHTHTHTHAHAHTRACTCMHTHTCEYTHDTGKWSSSPQDVKSTIHRHIPGHMFHMKGVHQPQQRSDLSASNPYTTTVTHTHTHIQLHTQLHSCPTYLHANILVVKHTDSCSLTASTRSCRH